MTISATHPVVFERPQPQAATSPGAHARTDLSAEALREIDLAVMILDEYEKVIYANARAAKSLGDDLIDTPFAELWSDDAEDVHETLAAVAAAPDWRAFTLNRGDRTQSVTVLWRGRRLIVNRPPMSPSRHLILTSDQLAARAPALLPPGAGAKPAERAAEADDRGELIHRVKNNLALLTSLVRTARRNVNDRDADAEMSTFERRLMSIAAMHEVLDARGSSEVLHAGDLLRRVCDGLGEALAPANVTISTDLAPVELPVSMGSPLALIANELLTNALKHGFPDGRVGTVEVALRTLPDGTYELCIRDDGVGAAATVAAAAAAPRASGGGHGGDIVRALVMQLGGALERIDQQAGTGWRLRFGESLS